LQGIGIRRSIEEISGSHALNASTPEGFRHYCSNDVKVTPGQQFPVLTGGYSTPSPRAGAPGFVANDASIIDASYTVVETGDGHGELQPGWSANSSEFTSEPTCAEFRAPTRNSSPNLHSATAYARAQSGFARSAKGTRLDVVA
jgi:hypothetical protein